MGDRLEEGSCAFDGNCHSSSAAASQEHGLDLEDTDDIYERLAARTSFHEPCNELRLVDPERFQFSFLYIKLLGGQGVCGEPMPGGALVPQDELNCVANWLISGGVGVDAGVPDANQPDAGMADDMAVADDMAMAPDMAMAEDMAMPDMSMLNCEEDLQGDETFCGEPDGIASGCGFVMPGGRCTEHCESLGLTCRFVADDDPEAACQPLPEQDPGCAATMRMGEYCACGPA
ncbi:MAG: hypothetical protein AAF411_31340 [Myxococcota bacterium]